jgi:dUTPase
MVAAGGGLSTGRVGVGVGVGVVVCQGGTVDTSYKEERKWSLSISICK